VCQLVLIAVLLRGGGFLDQGLPFGASNMVGKLFKMLDCSRGLGVMARTLR
jgi:hypothetical protein